MTNRTVLSRFSKLTEAQLDEPCQIELRFTDDVAEPRLVPAVFFFACEHDGPDVVAEGYTCGSPETHTGLGDFVVFTR